MVELILVFGTKLFETCSLESLIFVAGLVVLHVLVLYFINILIPVQTMADGLCFQFTDNNLAKPMMGSIPLQNGLGVWRMERIEYGD